MADIAKSDLNGDGLYNDSDRFGIANNSGTFYEAMLTGCDAEVIKQGEDGMPYFYCLDNMDEFTQVYQALLETFYTANRLYDTSSGQAMTMFTSGQSLFQFGTLAAAVQMRTSQADFGILPTPKWNEDQENYLNVSPNGDALMIPNSVDDLDRAGTILEALSYYSSQYYADDAVMPSYFEVLLRGKSVRDHESVESLQIIHDNISYVIKIVGTTLSAPVLEHLMAGNTDIGSLLKANEQSQRNKLAKILAELKDQ